MPKKGTFFSGNNTVFASGSGIFMPYLLTHYSIRNKGTVTIYLSHDGVTEADIIEPNVARYYDFDYQKNFYFRCDSGTYILYFTGW